jgi:hypothetical protein
MSAGDRTLGRRIESPFAAGGGLIGEWPQPGDYYLYPEAGWCGVSPNGHAVGLRNHDVAEHEDGTITVSPSILVHGDGVQGAWHGFLERGVWREV